MCIRDSSPNGAAGMRRMHRLGGSRVGGRQPTGKEQGGPAGGSTPRRSGAHTDRAHPYDS
eukprot:11286877-Alexandrium_andersonii.AAC.1